MIFARTLLALGVAAFSAAPLSAATLQPASDAELATALAEAQAGDEIILGEGRWRGPLVIDKALTLRGESGAVVDGQNEDSVIRVTADDVTIRDLTIIRSGDDRAEMNAGIFLDKTSNRALVEGNRLEDNLHGVRIHGSDDSIVRGNTIVGRSGRQQDLGNGVTVWNAPGAVIEGNHITLGRDGIFSNASKQNIFRDNHFESVRFAVHYMYTNDSEVSGNVSVGNAMGYAIMFSKRLKIMNNSSENDRDYGFLFNSANNSELSGNRVIGHPADPARWRDLGQTREEGVPEPEELSGSEFIAPTKCVFLYNANRNSFTGNHFEGCGMGIHFTAGSEGNHMSRNDFVDNRIQVKYVGTRTLEWSDEGVGNYWSDNSAFDLDGDGLADSVYRPNDMIDKVMWTAPQARMLMTSPAVQIIRFAQSRFPSVLPGGVTDSHPLMFPNSERPL
ncbi:nitrous oxide reductase family maturation protein NosD [uncultured Paracoccus sp.]|uniref:nitrous oxide reductase family maturation protein NosD n=1 Tax=uncultured Paracoccus sp. TaxID=189685 RepID=UPI0026272B2B|nr:nitrous oxide reductase family maturation protein NosD [uncultured Paracoccus sp.]